MPARQRIAQEIAARGGWISFARYMELALQAYYSGGAPKFGPGGDFVTAPELGTLFGRTLARGLPFRRILELGAGSGKLAQTLLQELDCEYFILETSAALRERQRERLGARVTFLDRLPERFRGLILANEVADALPVHLVAWTAQGIMERGVRLDAGAFAWEDRPAAGELLKEAEKIAVPVPYLSEIGLAARAWMRSLADSLEEGLILVIDYGFPRREFYHPQRRTGTLMCHYRHRAHGDPFYLPGLQDITAHVDFSALAHSASDAGLEILGFAGQAQFLVNCGIAGLLAQLDASDVRRYAPVAAAANRLLSPAEMGELFKVLVVGRGVTHALTGFAQGDRAHAL